MTDYSFFTRKAYAVCDKPGCMHKALNAMAGVLETHQYVQGREGFRCECGDLAVWYFRERDENREVTSHLRFMGMSLAEMDTLPPDKANRYLRIVDSYLGGDTRFMDPAVKHWLTVVQTALMSRVELARDKDN